MISDFLHPATTPAAFAFLQKRLFFPAIPYSIIPKPRSPFRTATSGIMQTPYKSFMLIMA